MPLSPPTPLAAWHVLDGFTSGVATLDDWLIRRARANQASGASRTFVLCDGHRIVGYHALAAGAIIASQAPGRFRRNMPDPLPVAVLARLAIDRAYQGRGLGRDLFRDAALRVCQAANTLGIRGIVVHAISDEARAFYQAIGFDASPHEPMTLMVTLADIQTLR